MAIQGMNHFTVLTHDLAATRGFYLDLLGFEEGWRPPFGFPGAWFYVDGKPILHVVAGRPVPQPPGGVLDHMAFSASDLPGTVTRLRKAGIKFDLRRQADDPKAQWQLFCNDPSGARVELDFRAEEPAPPPA
jgi:catechol 2,3-dioxygenase-like lactoylglutathione lyase family enzyme